MYLRLADEDEIIGTDWAEMGERAYGYLPFDEESSSPSHSSNEDHSNVVIDTRSQLSKNKSPRLSTIKKMLMVDRTTVIKGVPDLIEVPVMDYGQQKNLGSLPLNSLARPTGGDLIQKNATRVEEEHQEHDTVNFIHHPMSTSYHHCRPYESNDTVVIGSSTNSGTSPTSSSNSTSEKMKEKA
jgi:Amt family ammonium transporter